MIKVISTRGISFHIEEIIKEAQKEIILISPYLKIAPTLYERLAQADKRDIKITFVYGKSNLLHKQKKQLEKLEHCRILYKENLHAKMYLNEFSGVISSMNLYDFSEVNNTEVGVYFKKNSSENCIYEQAHTEAIDILTYSEIIKDIKKIEEKEKERNLLKQFLKKSGKNYIKDYPIKNIKLNKDYGFATYNFINKIRNHKNLKEAYLHLFEEALNEHYRVYWEYPYNRICIYVSKDYDNTQDKEKIEEYQMRAIALANEIIRKHIT